MSLMIVCVSPKELKSHSIEKELLELIVKHPEQVSIQVCYKTSKGKGRPKKRKFTLAQIKDFQAFESQYLQKQSSQEIATRKQLEKS